MAACQTVYVSLSIQSCPPGNSNLFINSRDILIIIPSAPFFFRLPCCFVTAYFYKEVYLFRVSHEMLIVLPASTWLHQKEIKTS